MSGCGCAFAVKAISCGIGTKNNWLTNGNHNTIRLCSTLRLVIEPCVRYENCLNDRLTGTVNSKMLQHPHRVEPAFHPCRLLDTAACFLTLMASITASRQSLTCYGAPATSNQSLLHTLLLLSCRLGNLHSLPRARVGLASRTSAWHLPTIRHSLTA